MRFILKMLFLIIAIIIFTLLLFKFADIAISLTPQNLSFGSVCIKDRCFQVELAKTEIQRDRGLMLRKELDKNKGMLFIFDKEGIYPFWMRKTLIPLDIIWINNNSEIVFISKNAQPCKSLICRPISPAVKSKYVLELNAGTSDETGLKVGDKLDITY